MAPVERTPGNCKAHLVAGAHDHELVVDVAQQVVHPAESRIEARRGIPERSRRNMIVEECIRLFAPRVDARFRESAKMQIGGIKRYANGLHASVRSALAQEDLIPINAQIGDDPDLAAARKETRPGPRSSSAFRPACPYPDSRFSRRRAASCTWRYGITKPAFDSCAALRKVLPSGQSTHPFSTRIALPDGRSGAEIQVE